MAIEILEHYLKNETHAHNYWHDLESLFYVVCWVCTAFSGPYAKRREFGEFSASHVYTWRYLTASEDHLKQAIDSKLSFTSSDKNFKRDMERDFHHYFAPIFNCVCQMRACLFPPASDEDGHKSSPPSAKELEGGETDEDVRAVRKTHLKLPHKLRDPEIVFEELFAIIDDAVEKLPEEHRLLHATPIGMSHVFRYQSIAATFLQITRELATSDLVR